MQGHEDARVRDQDWVDSYDPSSVDLLVAEIARRNELEHALRDSLRRAHDVEERGRSARSGSRAATSVGSLRTTNRSCSQRRIIWRRRSSARAFTPRPRPRAPTQSKRTG
jgi:hypothetical protein